MFEGQQFATKLMTFLIGQALFSVCGSCLLLGQAPANPPGGSKKASALTNPGIMKTDDKGVKTFVSEAAKTSVLPPEIPPASCAEWATQSSPTLALTDSGRKCKILGGDTTLCDRVSQTHAGTYDIGPLAGLQKVGQPLTVHFRVRDFGSGDYAIYDFGKVDWGDNSQQGIAPFGFDIPLSHTYTSAKTYTIHAMAGAQFKYQAGRTSGSYEGCVDNSIKVTIALR